MGGKGYRIEKTPDEYRVYLIEASPAALDGISNEIGQRVDEADFVNQPQVFPRPGRIDLAIETHDPESIEALRESINLEMERLGLHVGVITIVARTELWDE